MFANILINKQIQTTGNSFTVTNEIFKTRTQQHSRETKFSQLYESTFNPNPFTVVDTATVTDQASTLLDVVNLLYTLSVLKSGHAIKFLVMFDYRYFMDRNSNNVQAFNMIDMLNDVFGG